MRGSARLAGSPVVGVSDVKAPAESCIKSYPSRLLKGAIRYTTRPPVAPKKYAQKYAQLELRNDP